MNNLVKDYNPSKSSKCLFNAFTANCNSKINSDMDIENIKSAATKKEINKVNILGFGISITNCSPKNIEIKLIKKLIAPNV